MTNRLKPIFTPFHLAAPMSFIAGCAGSFAMAPTNYWWALFIAFPALYFCIKFAKSKKAAFAMGWLFSFGYFLLGLSWIGNALLVEGNPYAWAWPLAVCALPAALAFFNGFAALFIKFFPLDKITGFTAFCIGIFAAEWLRGHLFTGFPWNLYGYSWVNFDEIIQISSIGTVYLLTFCTILWASSPVLFTIKGRVLKYSYILVILTSFFANYIYGQTRIDTFRPFQGAKIQIKIVQPNIAQADKWDPSKIAEHFNSLLSLTENNEGHNIDFPTYIIWPETAIRDWYLNDPRAVQALSRALNSYPGGAKLLTGALMHNPEDQSYANALIQINQYGEVENIYNKSHLVPFGEYIPFQELIPLEPVAQFKGMTRGAGLEIISTDNGVRYSPLICYEIIFPGKTIPQNQTADLIINVTNDAWYGDSAGPRQHYIMAKFRAIETGTHVIRAANTGISGIFNPIGQSIIQSSLFEKSALMSTLSMPIKRYN